MIAIETRGLKVTHPLAEEPALKGVDLALQAGRVYGLIGHNGAGKTTLCNAIRGLIPNLLGGTVEGEIWIHGEPLVDINPVDLAAKVGLVFENPYTQLTGYKETVIEELAFGLENLGWERSRIIDRIAEVFVMLNLEKLAFRDPLELSGGQRQRVSLAAIIAMDTPILVIDEPTSQLDPASTDLIFEAVEELRRQSKTVLLVENKLDELVRVADEIVVLDQGMVKAQGNAVEALTTAANLGLRCGYPEVFQLSEELGLAERWITVTHSSERATKLSNQRGVTERQR